MKNLCERCGMPVKSVSQRGTEKDGTPSEQYCYRCMEKGKIINKDLTNREIYILGMEGVKDTKNVALKLYMNTSYHKLFTKGKLPYWGKEGVNFIHHYNTEDVARIYDKIGIKYEITDNKISIV